MNTTEGPNQPMESTSTMETSADLYAVRTDSDDAVAASASRAPHRPARSGGSVLARLKQGWKKSLNSSEGPNLHPRARRTAAILYRRLVEMGLWEHVDVFERAVTTGSGGARLRSRNNDEFLKALLATGRFCRDTPRGGLLHQGQISVREVTEGTALHLSLADDNLVYVHIDRVSPAVGATSEGSCRYDRARALAHMRREVFPLVMRSYRPASEESKSGRRARLDLYDAQRAWCEAVEVDRTEEAIEAGVRLAGLLAAEDESSQRRAQTLYRQAIDSGHPQFAPAAAFGLGILLEERNAYSEAQAAYRQAVESQHAEFSPRAAYNLGALFEAVGELERAKAAYTEAVGLGHPDMSSWAALRLGDVFVRLGEPLKAMEIYEKLASLRHPECASLGALSAARLLRFLGRTDDARKDYEKAISLGPVTTAATAASELEEMLERPSPSDASPSGDSKA